MQQIKGWLLIALVSMVPACAISDGDQEGAQYAGSASPSDSDEGDGDSSGDIGALPGQTNGGSEGAGGTGAEGVTLTSGCPAYRDDVYSPYLGYGDVSSGTPAALPWRGVAGAYPDSVEDFRAYSAGQQIECGGNKGARDYLDVTAGCLKAAAKNGNAVGEIHGTSVAEGYYRSLALPYDSEHERAAAWTDLGVEYKFFYSQWTSNVSGPGFKIFARYLSEYDLYVGSWRQDGVVQIQKKQCGVYTVLQRNSHYGPPAPNTWHTIRFEVQGNEQRLYLDGQLAMTTHDDSIKTGTAGIRIDSAESSLIDDWRVYAP